MAKVRPHKVSKVKVLYVLSPFDRARNYKGGLHCLLKKVKKSAREERKLQKFFKISWNKAEFLTKLSTTCFHEKRI